MLAHDERGRLAVDGAYLAVHRTIDAQPAGKGHVAVHRRSGTDQAVDTLLRRRLLLVKHGALLAEIQASRRLRHALTRLEHSRLQALYLRAGRHAEASLDALI